MKVRLAMAAALLAVTASAQGQNHKELATGNRLLAELQHADEHRRWGARGYVLGAAESSVLSGMLCFPRSVTARQVTDIVEQHLLRYPQMRDMEAAFLVEAALILYFECKK